MNKEVYITKLEEAYIGEYIKYQTNYAPSEVGQEFFLSIASYIELLRKQADEFLNKEKSYRENKEEYQALIADMQKEIVKLENELQSATAEKERKRVEIKKLKDKLEALKKLENSES